MNLFQSELWILVSFAAAGFQTVRFLLQKVLSTALLTPTGATFARFVYSAPIIVVAMAGYVKVSGAQVAFPSVDFWAYAVMGGLAQVLATICVVTLFKNTELCGRNHFQEDRGHLVRRCGADFAGGRCQPSGLWGHCPRPCRGAAVVQTTGCCRVGFGDRCGTKAWLWG